MSTVHLRPMTDVDLDALVALGLKAWAPVFESTRRALGPVLFERLYPTGLAGQADAIRRTCGDERMRVVVADAGAPAGFVAFAADEESRTGVVDMLAVDPAHQRAGLGRRLTEHAFAALAEAGMRVAVVETGGDPGHLPARRTYAATGAVLLPIARSFTAL